MPICVAKRSMVRFKDWENDGNEVKPDRLNYFLDNDLCVNSKEGVLEQEVIVEEEIREGEGDDDESGEDESGENDESASNQEQSREGVTTRRRGKDRKKDK